MAHLISPPVGRFLLNLSYDRTLTFMAMHRLARDAFGEDAPSHWAIAAFLSMERRGDGRLNRLRRDVEVASWIRVRSQTSTLDELLTSVRIRFGQARAPSRTALHRFLQRCGEPRPARRSAARLALGLAVVRIVKSEGAGKSLAECVALLRRRLGDVKGLSPSNIHRLCREGGIIFPRPGTRLSRDREVQAWIRWACMRLPITALRAEAVRMFGAERVPCRSALAREVAAQRRGRRPHVGRLTMWDRNPPLADFVRERCEGWTVDALLAELRRQFPGCDIPGRSTLSRQMSRERARMYGRKGKPSPR